MKKYLIGLIVLIMFGCTGCAASQYELTEQENDLIAEYIAGVLLQYDMGYNKKLLFETESEEVPALPEEDNTAPEVNQPKEEIPQAGQPEENQKEEPEEIPSVEYAKLADIYENKNFEITYTGGKTFSHYPEMTENSGFILEAGSGNDLLVLFFDVKNKTANKSSLNLMSSGIQYRLKIHTDSEKKPLLTALVNDLQYLEVEIEGKKSQEAVIVFKVPKGTKLEQSYLYASVGDKTAEEKIK